MLNIVVQMSNDNKITKDSATTSGSFSWFSSCFKSLKIRSLFNEEGSYLVSDQLTSWGHNICAWSSLDSNQRNEFENSNFAIRVSSRFTRARTNRLVQLSWLNLVEKQSAIAASVIPSAPYRRTRSDQNSPFINCNLPLWKEKRNWNRFGEMGNDMFEATSNLFEVHRTKAAKEERCIPRIV